jgi:hypothetical protein
VRNGREAAARQVTPKVRASCTHTVHGGAANDEEAGAAHDPRSVLCVVSPSYMEGQVTQDPATLSPSGTPSRPP